MSDFDLPTSEFPTQETNNVGAFEETTVEIPGQTESLTPARTWTFNPIHFSYGRDGRFYINELKVTLLATGKVTMKGTAFSNMQEVSKPTDFFIHFKHKGKLIFQAKISHRFGCHPDKPIQLSAQATGFNSSTDFRTTDGVTINTYAQSRTTC